MTMPARLDLDGRVVVVAGAGGGGIGTACCRVLAEAGAVVVALDIRPGALAAVEEACTGTAGRCRGVVADVRDSRQVDDALAIADELGPLHGLVHVAGGIRSEHWAALLDMSLDTYDEVMELNLRSALVTMKGVAARLVAQGNGGSLVVVSSVAAFGAMPFAAHYAAAKSGLLSLTRTAAVEWGAHSIRVNAVAPGTVRTPKTTGTADPNDADDADDPDSQAERAALPLARRGRGDDVAGAVLFFLSGLSGWVTGQVLAVDGGSSVRPSFLGADNLPVFVHNQAMRARLVGGTDG
jgi:3-oxoacyl-[acyl-carrier protein] reductase